MPASGEVDPEGIQVLSFLGKGNYASVYKAMYKGEPCAIKVVPAETANEHDRFSVQSFVHEAALMQCCHHENVLRVVCTAVLEGSQFKKNLPHAQLFAGGKSFAIALELAPGGTMLKKLLEQMLSPRSAGYDESQAMAWAIDIARGVEHLHNREHPIIHRDLKLENVLLVPGAKGEHTVAKIADFGLCALLKDGVAIAASDVKLSKEQASNMGAAVEAWIKSSGGKTGAAESVDIDSTTGLLTATSFATGAFVSMLTSLRERKSDRKPDSGPLKRSLSAQSASTPTEAAAAAIAAVPDASPEQVAVSVAPTAGGGAAQAPPAGAAAVPASGGKSMASMWSKIREEVKPTDEAPQNGVDGPAAAAAPPKRTLVKAKTASAAVARTFASMISVKKRKPSKYNLTGQTGSMAYMSPEVTRNEQYNEKADIFAVGVMLWEVFGRTSLVAMHTYEWELENHAKKVAHENYRPSMPNFFPPALSALVSKCWSPLPEDRPTASEVVATLQQMRTDGVLTDMFPANFCCCG